MTGTEIAVLVVGCVVAFAVSLAAIRFLMDYVKRHNFKFFGVYRIVLGIIVLAVAAVGLLIWNAFRTERSRVFGFMPFVLFCVPKENQKSTRYFRGAGGTN